jgi:hypothetical protein
MRQNACLLLATSRRRFRNGDSRSVLTAAIIYEGENVYVCRLYWLFMQSSLGGGCRSKGDCLDLEPLKLRCSELSSGMYCRVK